MQRFLRLRKESIFLHACSVTITQRNLWKPWDSAANDPTFFDDCGTVYKIWCKQKPRGRCNFVSAMLIEHRPFLTLHQKSLIIFSYILKAKYIFELGRWIANLPEKWEWIHFKVVVYIDNLHANTCHFSLHKLEWRHRTRLASGLRRRSDLASVSPWWGRVRLHVGYFDSLVLGLMDTVNCQKDLKKFSKEEWKKVG